MFEKQMDLEIMKVEIVNDFAQVPSSTSPADP